MKTGYIRSKAQRESEGLGKIGNCIRAQEPQDSLDRFIIAWERNDLPELEDSLGPNAKAALASLLRHRSWSGLRAELWRRPSPGYMAVGYRFEIPGSWSKPDGALGEKESIDDGPVNPDLDTRFTDSSGHDCGRLGVRFIGTRVGVGRVRFVAEYFVDNSDLRDLLRLIATCAVP